MPLQIGNLRPPYAVRARKVSGFRKHRVVSEGYDRMVDSILVEDRDAGMGQRFRGYRVTGTPDVHVDGLLLSDVDMHGETREPAVRSKIVLWRNY